MLFIINLNLFIVKYNKKRGKQMRNKGWYKLDNAGQVFPMVSNNKDTNSFRLACVLKENIDHSLLKEALEITLKRFPSFQVRLKKGYFWYYLEKNISSPIIREESPYFCQSNDYSIQNNYPFNLSYYGKRISIEIFHALTDGTGGLEFFKAIIFNYLILKGYKIENNGEILTNQVESLLDETEDSFIYNYNHKIKKAKNESKAFTIKGTKYYNNWTGVIQVICDTKTLKDAANKYNATITQYLTSIFLNSIYENYAKYSKDKNPIRLFIPVNARKYFSSKTLRNFALFIRTNTILNNEITFLDIIKHVKDTFDKELQKDKMLARIKTNIKFEKNPLTRIIPLFIKKLVTKFIYKHVGRNANTMSFSNLGIALFPPSCPNYIDRMEFAMGASSSSPINCTAITYNNKTIITMTTCIIERKFELFTIKKLKEDNVELIIETNDLEVEHEKM